MGIQPQLQGGGGEVINVEEVVAVVKEEVQKKVVLAGWMVWIGQAMAMHGLRQQLLLTYPIGIINSCLNI